MNYYMITVYTDENTKEINYRPFINPYETLKDAQNAVNWQKIGGFENQIIAKRIDKTKFKNLENKEIIQIDENNRQPYTVDAWQKFLNRQY